MATYTESAPILWRFQCDPAAGAFPVQAFFKTELVNDDEPTDTLSKDGGSVSFDLPSGLAAQIVTLANAAR